METIEEQEALKLAQEDLEKKIKEQLEAEKIEKEKYEALGFADRVVFSLIKNSRDVSDLFRHYLHIDIFINRVSKELDKKIDTSDIVTINKSIANMLNNTLMSVDNKYLSSFNLLNFYIDLGQTASLSKKKHQKDIEKEKRNSRRNSGRKRFYESMIVIYKN